MNLFVEERDDSSFAFWADGDLQFDSADEAVYHEMLALPALTLAQQALPDGGAGLRVLICGGGDGLALRETLRFPDVRHVDLVDYSAEIVELGRTRFADLNRRAFEDSRAHVQIGDAWEFLERVSTPYDVILCDFTTPRRTEDTRIMTRDWYARVAGALAPNGVAGINAVSPQTAPEAFWCLRKTVRAGGLNAIPFRACIPSFRAQGYGTWAFFLAAHRPLRRADLRTASRLPGRDHGCGPGAPVGCRGVQSCRACSRKARAGSHARSALPSAASAQSRQKQPGKRCGRLPAAVAGQSADIDPDSPSVPYAGHGRISRLSGGRIGAGA